MPIPVVALQDPWHWRVIRNVHIETGGELRGEFESMDPVAGKLDKCICTNHINSDISPHFIRSYVSAWGAGVEKDRQGNIILVLQ